MEEAASIVSILDDGATATVVSELSAEVNSKAALASTAGYAVTLILAALRRLVEVTTLLFFLLNAACSFAHACLPFGTSCS